MEYKIIVVGIGPGSPDYLLPAAKTAIEKADVLVGSKRALTDYGKGKRFVGEITGRIEETLSMIKGQLVHGDVTVMVSGDPGYYSLLDALRRSFPASSIVVIPGISSMQLAFARLALPWQGAALISLHGREPKDAEFVYCAGKMLGLLTDTVYHSQRIGALLKANGWPEETKVHLCTRLSYEDERIIETKLGEIDAAERVSHCIMVVIG